MVFAKHLRNIGDNFRKKYLNSTDVEDATLMNEDWRKNQKKEGSAKGGPYLAVHLRRADFLYAHADKVPSLDAVVSQVNELLEKHKLDKVFVATDGTKEGEKFVYISKRKLGCIVCVFVLF